MGAGSSQEAEWTLVDDIAAGEWLLVADCFVIQPIDVRFEVIWRKAAGGDVPIVMWEQHFDPNPDGRPQVPQAHELRGDGARVGPNATGDQLIFRYTGLTGTIPMAWIPNGDGPQAMARIPYLALP